METTHIGSEPTAVPAPKGAPVKNGKERPFLQLAHVHPNLTVRILRRIYQLPDTKLCRSWAGQRARVYYRPEAMATVLVVVGDDDDAGTLAEWIGKEGAPAPKVKAAPPKPLPELLPLREVTLDVQDMAGVGIIQALAEAGHITIRRKQDPPVPEPEEQLPVCPVCGQPTKSLQLQATLEQEVCLLCHVAAGKIVNRYRQDLQRHDQEFHGQLSQMVKDVRAGADEPTFYRGLE